VTHVWVPQASAHGGGADGLEVPSASSLVRLKAEVAQLQWAVVHSAHETLAVKRGLRAQVRSSNHPSDGLFFHHLLAHTSNETVFSPSIRTRTIVCGCGAGGGRVSHAGVSGEGGGPPPRAHRSDGDAGSLGTHPSVSGFTGISHR
jgi:hypothetical protein